MVDLLRSRGYDVLTSYETGQANQKIPDYEVLMYAINAGRVVIYTSGIPKIFLIIIIIIIPIIYCARIRLERQ